MRTSKSIWMAVLLSAVSVFAETSFNLTDDLTLRAGGDIRARYEGYTQGVVQPNTDADGKSRTEYLRVRTRVWLALDVAKELTFNFRLGNRFHYVTTSPSDPNNNGASTWEFPDEVYVDAANIVFNNLCDDILQLTIGRQNLTLGNGMILGEGTPFDQGRSLYNDGIVAQFKWENKDSLTLFGFYDEWKDRTVFINSQHRRLRIGNVLTAGIYWTHLFEDKFKWDLYYMFNKVDDPQSGTPKRGHFDDSSADIHTVGFRFFGAFSEYADYSFEHASQFGHLADDQSLGASMQDARLTFKLIPNSELKPALTFNVTRFSGNDPHTSRYEGWIPIMSESPHWGEELIPIMLAGNWTNLLSLRTAFSLAPIEKLTVAISGTDYYADEKHGAVAGINATGGGSHFGFLANLCVSYKLFENLALQAQISHFKSGSYFSNGQDSSWARLEVAWNF